MRAADRIDPDGKLGSNGRKLKGERGPANHPLRPGPRHSRIGRDDLDGEVIVWDSGMTAEGRGYEEAAMRDPETPRRRRWRRLALVASILILTFTAGGLYPLWAYPLTGYRHYYLPANSMAPTLKLGDHVRVEEGGGQGMPGRGEIWIFQAPGPAPQIHVKRIIGLPGETIEVRAGRVRVNGEALSEPYIMAPPTYGMAPLRLGPDQYFVLGDNRNASTDSHNYGPLPRAAFLGRVRARVWPPNRIRRF
jgi:signal peptidase I